MKTFTFASVALLLSQLALSQPTSTGQLQTVTEFTDYRGAGVTVTPKGRIIISMHPLDNPKYRLVEVMANGTKQPFPNADWADGPQGKVGLTAVIGVHSDKQGVVWMLDMGDSSHQAKLIAWDTQSNSLLKNITIPQSSLVDNSFPQDFVIDEKRGKIYIADMSFGNFSGASKPAIIAVDIASGKTKRILEGFEKFIAPDRDMIIEATRLASKKKDGSTNPLRFGLNPIAIDDSYKWVYFATMNGEKVHRVPAELLADFDKSDKAIKTKIEFFGPKKPSDGMHYVPGLGLAVTDLENNAIGLTTKNNYQILIQDKQLSWPDSLAVSGNYIYVTQDQLHQHPAFSQGLGNAKPPYKLMRFKFK